MGGGRGFGGWERERLWGRGAVGEGKGVERGGRRDCRGRGGCWKGRWKGLRRIGKEGDYHGFAGKGALVDREDVEVGEGVEMGKGVARVRAWGLRKWERG